MVHDNFTGFFTSGTLTYESIQKWIDSLNSRSSKRCRLCSNIYMQSVIYLNLPKIITFDSASSITLQSETVLNYRLTGVIYFEDMHFVSRVIRQDGQV